MNKLTRYVVAVILLITVSALILRISTAYQYGVFVRELGTGIRGNIVLVDIASALVSSQVQCGDVAIALEDAPLWSRSSNGKHTELHRNGIRVLVSPGLKATDDFGQNGIDYRASCGRLGTKFGEAVEEAVRRLQSDWYGWMLEVSLVKPMTCAQAVFASGYRRRFNQVTLKLRQLHFGGGEALLVKGDHLLAIVRCANADGSENASFRAYADLCLVDTSCRYRIVVTADRANDANDTMRRILEGFGRGTCE